MNRISRKSDLGIVAAKTAPNKIMLLKPTG